jgi:hypothetical protein
MDKAKLTRAKKKLARLRSHIANIRSQELISLAESLGRELYKRGKEPNYVSTIMPKKRPISIPNHPGSLNKFTAGSILDDLEQDIFNIEEKLESEGERNG